MITKKELELLQKTELNILKDFHDFCLANNLRYYLIGGALLGVARYNGFIPWDDDIDVVMPREDYERLKAIWKNKENGKYFLQNSQTDSKFSRCIMKLRKNGTILEEAGTVNVKMNKGIYIDIFPFDYISDKSDKKVIKRAKKIRKLMSLRAIKSGYKGRHMFIKTMIRVLLFWLPTSWIDKKIDYLCTLENNKSRNYAVLYLHNYDYFHQVHSIDVFGEGVLGKFEGDEFYCPQKTDEFLSKVFGSDYIKEPPVEKQVNPHNYMNIYVDKV